MEETVNLNMEVESEEKSRKNILNHARRLGCEKEMILLFEKYDKLLRNCKNKSERDDIGKLGCVEMFNLLNTTGTLTVNYKKVIER